MEFFFHICLKALGNLFLDIADNHFLDIRHLRRNALHATAVYRSTADSCQHFCPFSSQISRRNARNGTLYTSQGKINIKRREFAEDDSPLDPACGCYTCRTFSKAYLRHLYVSQELLSFRLNSIHNLAYFLNLVRSARQAILEDRYEAYYQSVAACYPEELAKTLEGPGLA